MSAKPSAEPCPLGGLHRPRVLATWAACPRCHKAWWRCDPVRGPDYEGDAFVPVLP